MVGAEGTVRERVVDYFRKPPSVATLVNTSKLKSREFVAQRLVVVRTRKEDDGCGLKDPDLFGQAPTRRQFGTIFRFSAAHRAASLSHVR
jgi:hypothetical protein